MPQPHGFGLPKEIYVKSYNPYLVETKENQHMEAYDGFNDAVKAWMEDDATLYMPMFTGDNLAPSACVAESDIPSWDRTLFAKLKARASAEPMPEPQGPDPVASSSGSQGSKAQKTADSTGSAPNAKPKPSSRPSSRSASRGRGEGSHRRAESSGRGSRTPRGTGEEKGPDSSRPRPEPAEPPRGGKSWTLNLCPSGFRWREFAFSKTRPATCIQQSCGSALATGTTTLLPWT